MSTIDPSHKPMPQSLLQPLPGDPESPPEPEPLAFIPFVNKEQVDNRTDFVRTAAMSSTLPVNRVLVATVLCLVLIVGWLILSRSRSTPTVRAATSLGAASSPPAIATDADIEIKGSSERDDDLLHYAFTGHMTNTSLLNAPNVELDAVFHYSIHNSAGDYKDGPSISIPIDTFHNLRPEETRDFNGAAAFQKTVPGYGNYPCFGGTNGWMLDCAGRRFPVPYKVTVATHVTPNP